MARTRRLDDFIMQLGGAARSKQVDVETLIRRLVEEAVEQALRRSHPPAAGPPPGDGLEHLEERLARLEERLERLEEAVNGLRGAPAPQVDPARLAGEVAARVVKELEPLLRGCRGGHGGGAGEEPQWLRVLRERLRGRGYVAAAELPPEVRAALDPGLLREKGLVVIEAGAGGPVVATREALEEFTRLLKTLKTGDEYEAEARLGRYGLLFKLLRMEGRLYYGGPGRGWVLRLPGG